MTPRGLGVFCPPSYDVQQSCWRLVVACGGICWHHIKSDFSLILRCSAGRLACVTLIREARWWFVAAVHLATWLVTKTRQVDSLWRIQCSTPYVFILMTSISTETDRICFTPSHYYLSSLFSMRSNCTTRLYSTLWRVIELNTATVLETSTTSEPALLALSVIAHVCESKLAQTVNSALWWANSGLRAPASSR